MPDKKSSQDKGVSSRRKALTAGAVGVVAWKTPVLTAVVTPAHAQTSVTTTVAPVVMQVVVTASAAFFSGITFTSTV